MRPLDAFPSSIARRASVVLAGGLLALVAGCAATANPDYDDASATPSFAEGTRDAARGFPGSAGAANQTPDAPGRSKVAVASVAGREVDVRALLARAWWRSSSTLREMLEQLVVEQLAAVEAERLGISADPAARQDAVEDAWIALRARIVEGGLDLAPEEFVRRVLGLDPEFYAAQLAGDAEVQLLLERVVRAWSLASERSALSILAVEDGAIARKIIAELEGGRPFAELSSALGGAAQDIGLDRVTVVHDERVELARAARLTPVGGFGGPMEESGRFLIFEVLEHLEAYAGPVLGARGSAHPAFLAAVDQSLAADPVADIEYLQWRAAMERKYEIDLSPFAELVEERP